MYPPHSCSQHKHTGSPSENKDNPPVQIKKQETINFTTNIQLVVFITINVNSFHFIPLPIQKTNKAIEIAFARFNARTCLYRSLNISPRLPLIITYNHAISLRHGESFIVWN